MRVSLDTRAWDRALTQLGKGNAIKAGVRAVNRTLKNAKTAMVKVVAQDMGLQAKAVRDKIAVKAAVGSGEATRGYLFADTRRVPLIDFKARGPEPSRGRGKGVRARLPGGAGTYPKAFIATMKSGHRGVFQRAGTTRLGIYELRGPSIAQSFTKNAAVAEARAAEMLEKNMAAEVNYLLLKAKQSA